MKKALQLLPFFIFLLCINSTFAQDLNPAQWRNMTGYWKFQDAGQLTKATVGNALTLVGKHQWVPGPAKTDTAIRIGMGSYYACKHNIAPNGGGDSVNQYTLLFDFKILSLKKWHTFFQTDTTNKNDGDCFIRPLNSSTPGRIGVGATGYSNDSVIPNKWYRLVISVNLGHFYRYYLNGQLIHEGDTQDIDDRFSLNPHFLLFADDFEEDDTMDVASVAVFDTCLSASDIAKIGTIDPCVLHPMSLSLGKDTTICGGNSLIKTLAGGYTYKWSTGETTASATFNLTKNGSGIKTISVRQTDVNGCFLMDTFKLGIYNSPTVNLGRDTGFCEGQKLKLTAGSAANNSYTWTLIPVGRIVSKINSLSIDSSGAYMVLMSNQYGCTDRDTITVTVYANPAKPSLISLRNKICKGDSVYINGPAGYKTYTWNTGQSAPGFYVYATQTFDLYVEDIYGCVSPVSDTLRITVNPLPATPVIGYLPDTIVCAGNTTVLSTPAIHAAYLWNDGFNQASRQVSASGTFSLTVKNSFGCQSAVSNIVHVTVHPKPAKPGITFSGSADRCTGDTATIFATDSAVYYEWNTGSNERAVKAWTDNSFKLRVYNGLNCASDWSDSVNIRFHVVPTKPSIIQTGNNTLECSTTADAYLWEVNHVVGNDKLNTIRARNTFVYRVRTGNGWCWSAYSDTFLYFESSILTAGFEKSILRISPNPASQIVSIKLVNQVDDIKTRIRIMNVSGQELTAYDIAGTDALQLSVAAWPAGVYLLLIEQGGAVYTQKLLIE